MVDDGGRRRGRGAAVLPGGKVKALCPLLKRSSERTRPDCCSTSARPFPRNRCTCPALISSSAFTSTRTARCRCSASSSRCSITAGSPAPATSRSCRSIRASSIPPARRSRRTRMYFDPENIVKLAIEGGCNAVASTLGVLGMCARKYAHRFRSSSSSTTTSSFPIRTATTRSASRASSRAFDMGAAGVGATIYFGSEESKRQIQEVDRDVPAGARARHVHRAVVLPAQLRRSRPRTWTTTSPPI